MHYGLYGERHYGDEEDCETCYIDEMSDDEYYAYEDEYYGRNEY